MNETSSPPGRPLLSIETSGASGSVAILLTDGSLVERAVGSPPEKGERPSGHGRELVPVIDALLAEAGVARSDLGAIAVSVGPGSYTGLRIGVTAAKTLAWAVSCDLVGVSTLKALARDCVEGGVPEGTRRVAPVLDARQREVYAALFEIDGESVRRSSEDAALPPARLRALLGDGDHVFGTGARLFLGDLALPDGATSSDGPTCPRAATVALLGAGLLARGELMDVHSAAPAYLRATEAERKAGVG